MNTKATRREIVKDKRERERERECERERESSYLASVNQMLIPLFNKF